MEIGRRRFLLTTVGAAVVAHAAFGAAYATARPRVRVYKSPFYACCGGWIAHMKADGFDVEVLEVADVTPYRQRLGVPEALSSCHTAEVEGYAIEGHVPAADVHRLLRERPKGDGLALPGMVPGSPGMGRGAVRYETLLFDRRGNFFKIFARH